jgi:glycosyltransferase involved in cell wall biosynthesis
MSAKSYSWQRPTISVALTIKNARAWAANAIESVLAQTRGDFELIIWDDSSKDGSFEMAQTYASVDPRIRLFRSRRALGVGGALAAAHRRARGRYVGYVDHDDWLAPTALEETAAVLDSNPKVGLVYTDCYEVRGDSIELGWRTSVPFSRERLLLWFMTFHFRLLRRKTFLRAGGIRANFPQCADYDLCLRMSELAGVAHLPRPLYYYRVHEGSVSFRQQSLNQKASARALRDALRRRGLNRKLKLEVSRHGEFLLKPRARGSRMPVLSSWRILV